MTNPERVGWALMPFGALLGLIFREATAGILLGIILVLVGFLFVPLKGKLGWALIAVGVLLGYWLRGSMGLLFFGVVPAFIGILLIARARKAGLSPSV